MKWKVLLFLAIIIFIFIQLSKEPNSSNNSRINPEIVKIDNYYQQKLNNLREPTRSNAIYTGPSNDSAMRAYWDSRENEYSRRIEDYYRERQRILDERQAAIDRLVEKREQEEREIYEENEWDRKISRELF